MGKTTNQSGEEIWENHEKLLSEISEMRLELQKLNMEVAAFRSTLEIGPMQRRKQEGPLKTNNKINARRREIKTQFFSEEFF
jgi:hypothetical protein